MADWKAVKSEADLPNDSGIKWVTFVRPILDSPRVAKAVFDECWRWLDESGEEPPDPVSLDVTITAWADYTEPEPYQGEANG